MSVGHWPQRPTMPVALLNTVRRQPEAPALRAGPPEPSVTFTYGEYADRIKDAVAALSHCGLGPGDRVLISTTNRPEFYFLDAAAQLLRLIPISIYSTASIDEIKYYASHSGARLAIAESGSRFDQLAAAVGGGIVGDLRSLEDVLAGREGGDADLENLASLVQPDDVATMIYTSGTTGPPKAVQLTHRNLSFMVSAWKRSDPSSDYTAWRMVSYLPLAHIAERLSSLYVAPAYGMEVICCADAGNLVPCLRDARPTMMFGVPRTWEKLQAALQRAATSDSPSACRGALAAVGLDAVQRAYAGSAPSPQHLLRWFHEAGIPLADVYGLSETTGLVTVQHADKRLGTVGRPLPGVEVRLAADNEILCRGENVFAGYWNDLSSTSAAVDADGWLYTGDVGSFDGDGWLKLVGRKKELIITSGGKNISPTELEAGLAEIPLVERACVLGDGRRYVTAIISLDLDAAAKCETHQAGGTGDLARSAEVLARIQEGVNEFNSRLSRPQQVKRFAVVADQWQPGTALMTPTSKLRRREIASYYAELIDSLYES
jgi:long-chain acyl-CoA synthetase